VTGPVRVAVLGDSLSEGVGDPVPGGWRGWGTLLAQAITDDPAGVDVLNIARSGARSADVAGPQLAAALAHRPHVATVVAGGNDTLRGAFSVAEVAAGLHTAIGTLRGRGTVVLTACLPDPGDLLGLPWPLARPLARRMDAVNTVVHALSDHHGTVHLHAAEHPWSTARGALSADRLHPGETGHRLLAHAFHALLVQDGLATGPAPRLAPDRPPPGPGTRLWWMATKGTRWIAERSRDLLPDLLRLAADEYRHERRGTAVLLDLATRAETERALSALGVRPAAAPALALPAGGGGGVPRHVDEATGRRRPGASAASAGACAPAAQPAAPATCRTVGGAASAGSATAQSAAPATCRLGPGDLAGEPRVLA
jgi:lysophospholipase L1-like esterase